jgi:SRSO17 transposase
VVESRNALQSVESPGMVAGVSVSRKSIAAEAILAGASWCSVSWRCGTKGRLSTRFAVVRVRVADGPPQSIRDMGGQYMPGDEAWLIGERRATGEHKYYLSNLPTDSRTSRITCARLAPSFSSASLMVPTAMALVAVDGTTPPEFALC